MLTTFNGAVEMVGGAQDGRLSNAENKIAVVETRLGYIESRVEVSGTKTDLLFERLTRLEEKVSHLPTKEQVVKIALGTLATLTAIIVFQSKIQALIGAPLTH